MFFLSVKHKFFSFPPIKCSLFPAFAPTYLRILPSHRPNESTTLFHRTAFTILSGHPDSEEWSDNLKQMPDKAKDLRMSPESSRKSLVFSKLFIDKCFYFW